MSNTPPAEGGPNTPSTPPRTPVGGTATPRSAIPTYLQSQSPTDSSPSDHPSSAAHVTLADPVEGDSPSRRRAHTVAVSIRPRSESNASAKQGPLRGIRTSLSSVRGKAEPDDEEAILTGEGDEPIRRKRATSIVDRLRDSVGSPKERRESTGSGSVAYEMLSKRRRSGEDAEEEGRELNDEVVGMLDVIDPEVSTVNHLQNVTNGIFVPHFPALWSRRPEIKLGGDMTNDNKDDEEDLNSPGVKPRKRSSTVAGLYPSAPPSTTQSSFPQRANVIRSDSGPKSRSDSQSNAIPTTTYPPKSAELQPTSSNESTSSEAHALDEHVRKVIHQTKRQRIKTGLKGFWVFVKTPMGFLTAIYGLLVVFWGAAIVFFLLNWVPTPSKYWQDRWVEISSQIVNALFTIPGVGLIPWRAQDTYRMSIIWTLRQRLHRRRRKAGLPPLEDPNDIEDPKEQEDYVSVLSEKERGQLKYQQEMFAKSQTWYRPHATSTHRAFPMSWALWNTILMDLNSAFQCILCGCMWGLSQYERPAWTTGSLIPLGFVSGIGAGVLIWQGSARTKKVISVNEKLRQALSVSLAVGGQLDTKRKPAAALEPVPTSETPTTVSATKVTQGKVEGRT